MPPCRSPPAATQFGSLHRLPARGAVSQNRPPDGRRLGRTHGEQMLLAAVRALIVGAEDGVGTPVAVCVGSGVVPTRLGTPTTYGLPAPRVTSMTSPA